MRLTNLTTVTVGAVLGADPKEVAVWSERWHIGHKVDGRMRYTDRDLAIMLAYHATIDRDGRGRAAAQWKGITRIRDQVRALIDSTPDALTLATDHLFAVDHPNGPAKWASPDPGKLDALLRQGRQTTLIDVRVDATRLAQLS